MALTSEQVASAPLVGGESTGLHSHPGGGADVKSGRETAITEGSTRAVTFGTAFGATPNVIVSFDDGSTQLSVAQAESISATGFTIRVFKVGGGGNASRDVAWIASDAGNL